MLGHSKKVAIYKPGRQLSSETDRDKHPDLWLSAFRTVEKLISFVKPPSLWCFVMAGQANKYRYLGGPKELGVKGA